MEERDKLISMVILGILRCSDQEVRSEWYIIERGNPKETALEMGRKKSHGEKLKTCYSDNSVH